MGKRLCEVSKGEVVKLCGDNKPYRVVSNRTYTRKNRTYYAVLQSVCTGRLRGLPYNRKRRIK